MITIDIPEWLQYAALGLAIAYAVPKAIRVVVVTATYVRCLLRKEWPLRTADRDGRPSLYATPIRGAVGWVVDDIVAWAFGHAGTKSSRSVSK